MSMEFVHDRSEMVTDGTVASVVSSHMMYFLSRIYTCILIYVYILVKTSADLGTYPSPVRDDTFSVLHRLLEIDTLRTEHRSCRPFHPVV